VIRRKLSSRGAQAFALGGAAALNVELQTRAFSKQPAAGEDYYQKLGVTPFLHAAGTYTVLLLFHELQSAKAFRNMETVAHRRSPGNVVPTGGRPLTMKEIDSQSVAGGRRATVDGSIRNSHRSMPHVGFGVRVSSS
jgi:hypothetical protein